MAVVERVCDVLHRDKVAISKAKEIVRLAKESTGLTHGAEARKIAVASFVSKIMELDASDLGDPLPNVKSNINRFTGRFPENPIINEEYNPYEFE